jgi:undecaprenyl-diphosphatase
MVSKSADGWLYLSLPLLIYMMEKTQFVSLVVLALVGFIIERSIYYVIKKSIKRPRPPEAIDGFKSVVIASDEFSFPSGHTSAAFFFCTFICLTLSISFWPLYLWAMLVGASRVFLGVHFPTDILMGAVLGTSVAFYLV